MRVEGKFMPEKYSDAIYQRGAGPFRYRMVLMLSPEPSPPPTSERPVKVSGFGEHAEKRIISIPEMSAIIAVFCINSLPGSLIGVRAGLFSGTQT
jgi:hypothetical protein